MQARAIHMYESDSNISDQEIFSQIESTLLQPYHQSRDYESDMEKRDITRSIMEVEEGKSEESMEEVVKELQQAKKKVRKERPKPPENKMAKTTTLFDKVPKKKMLSERKIRKKRRKPIKHTLVFNQRSENEGSPIVRQAFVAPPKAIKKVPSGSPYSELLFKRYKEYQPSDQSNKNNELNEFKQDQLHKLESVYGQPQKRSDKKKKGREQLIADPFDTTHKLNFQGIMGNVSRPPIIPKEFLIEQREDRKITIDQGKNSENQIEDFSATDH